MHATMLATTANPYFLINNIKTHTLHARGHANGGVGGQPRLGDCSLKITIPLEACIFAHSLDPVIRQAALESPLPGCNASVIQLLVINIYRPRTLCLDVLVTAVSVSHESESRVFLLQPQTPGVPWLA